MAESQSTLAVCCLKCGGELQFDPTVGKLRCEYCDATFTVEEAEAHYKEKEQSVQADNAERASSGYGDEYSDGSDENMRAYSCSSCGAELMADNNTAAMRCPYCGNSTIAPTQFSGDIRPDYIIPFKFTKQQAEEKYKSYYVKRKLLPRSFITGNHVEEIQGVYVPFWMYSGNASIDAVYDANDKKETSSEIIIDHYKAWRSGTISFENVPADASKRMPDDLMDSIEPYNLGELTQFSMSYLPGFLAERYDVSAEEDLPRVETRVKQSISSKTKDTVKHDSVSANTENIEVDVEEQKYAMLPVWYLTTKWDGKLWNFAMNGQTGAFIGDLPIDKGKMTGVIAAAFVIAAALLYFILHVDIIYALLGGAVVGGITGGVCYSSMKPVARASRADEYTEAHVHLTSQRDEFVRTERKKKENK